MLKWTFLKPVSLSLQTKFSLGIFAMLFLVASILSYGLYRELQESLIKSVYEKSQIILTELEATRNYVSAILRPKMSSLIDPEEFIPEGMSTSYVTRKIMERFRDSLTEFSYKRAAIDPRNPLNTADETETLVINNFSGNKLRQDWQGMVTRDGKSYFVRMSPIYMEESCLKCHSDAVTAPMKLVSLYGDQAGFGRKVGDVAGLDVVYFPVDHAMAEIREQTVSVLGAGVLAAIIFFLLTQIFFKRLVADRVGKIESFLNSFASSSSYLSSRLEIGQNDEIGKVSKAFNTMADRLGSLMAERNRLLDESIFQQIRIRSIFDGITDRLMLLAPDKTVLMANAASMESIDQGDHQFRCYELIHSKDGPCANCLISRAINDGVPVSGEISHTDGETFLAHFYPIRNSKTGEVESVVHYCKSITEKKKIELQMRQAEKLASMGQLVAGVAHELNNPLGIILFYSDLVRQELKEGSQEFQDMVIIEKSAETCKKIVHDLLAFAGNVEASKILCDLNETINRMVGVLEKQFSREGVTFCKDFDQSVPLIPLDESRIQQVWLNLMLNARQAIGANSGQILISTSLADNGNYAQARFRDNGCGMSEDVASKVFDPFFTTKGTGEGTGLGLSVSYGIISEHGGTISVHSQQGYGATFEVLLPIAPGRNAHVA